MSLTSWTNQQILDQLVFGTSWLNSISNSAILYRLPTSSDGVYAPNNEHRGFEPLNAKQVEMARLAFATWGDLIPIPIVETTKSWPHIDVANTRATDFAHAYFPIRSSIWFNSNERDLQDPKLGRYGFETFVHEIGHALGLEHMGNYNGAGNWEPSCFEDSSVYSVMSYFGPEHADGEGQVAWADWSVKGVTYSPQTPMLNDVMAIQHIYGANTLTRSGNTTYGFNSNVLGIQSAIYDFSKNAFPILTLFDAGGIDTLDLSGWNTDSRIDLHPGAFSDCNEMTSNLTIAYGCIIENLITGGGDDLLIGNMVSNQLWGGSGNDQIRGAGGNDFIDGGLGIDTALFDGNLANYSIGYDGNSLKVYSRDPDIADVDTLQNIEFLRFEDFTISYGSAVRPGSNSDVQLSGVYADFKVYATNNYFTVIDLLGSLEIAAYENVSRLKFNNLAAALDIDAGESVGQVYRLYLSVLGRNPVDDPVGCGFWVDKLDRNLTNIEGLVQTFLGSEEFVNRFGSSTSTNESFVNLLYLNLLGRDGHPDPGFQFWQSILDDGKANRAQVVVGFMESPENVGNIADLIGDHATYSPWIDVG